MTEEALFPNTSRAISNRSLPGIDQRRQYSLKEIGRGSPQLKSKSKFTDQAMHEYFFVKQQLRRDLNQLRSPQFVPEKSASISQRIEIMGTSRQQAREKYEKVYSYPTKQLKELSTGRRSPVAEEKSIKNIDFIQENLKVGSPTTRGFLPSPRLLSPEKKEFTIKVVKWNEFSNTVKSNVFLSDKFSPYFKEMKIHQKNKSSRSLAATSQNWH